MRKVTIRLKKGLFQPRALCYVICNDEEVGELRFGSTVTLDLPSDIDLKIKLSSPSLFAPVLSETLKFAPSEDEIELVGKGTMGGLVLEEE